MTVLCHQALLYKAVFRAGLPNVVILSGDGLAADHLSVYSNERPTTPFLGIRSARSQYCCGSSATMVVTLPTSAWTPFARMTDYPAIAELAWTNFGCCFKVKMFRFSERHWLISMACLMAIVFSTLFAIMAYSVG